MKNKLFFYFVLIILSSVFSCLNERDNPHDPALDDGYRYGEPEMSIQYGQNTIAEDGTIAIGDTDSGSSTDITITIKNTGTAYLELDKMEITKSDEYSVIGTPFTTINPGSSSNIVLRFSPASPGLYTVSVTIYYFLEDIESFSFIVSGNGI